MLRVADRFRPGVPAGAARPMLAAALMAFLALACGGCAGAPDLYSDSPPVAAASPAQATGALEGFVFDRDTNPVTPIVGAIVYTLPTAEPGARTDGAGFFRLSNLTPGRTTVVSRDNAGKTLIAHVEIRSSQVTTLDLAYGTGPAENRLEIGLLTRAFTPGVSSTASIGPKGAAFQLRPLPQLGGNLTSMHFSRASSDELLVVSDFDSPAGEIYLANTKAGTTRRLTSNGIAEESADLSPDGERIVYAVDTDGNGRLEILSSRLDGTRLVTLVADADAGTTRLRDSRDPVWSPDGTAIGFVTRRRDAGAPVLETSFDVALLPVAVVIDPASPQFDTVRPTGLLQRLSADLFDDRHPAWDETSGNLYYDKLEAGHRQLYTVSAVPGGRELRLTSDLFENTHPSVSFDGQFIAWVSTSTAAGRNPDTGPEIFVAEFLRKTDLATGLKNVRQLTDTDVSSGIDFASFRPLFPGRERLVNGTLR